MINAAQQRVHLTRLGSDKSRSHTRIDGLEVARLRDTNPPRS
jgi:hypothetical protein